MGAITLEGLHLHNPKLCAEVHAEGLKEGTRRERSRCSCIMTMRSARKISAVECGALIATDIALSEIPDLLERVRSVKGKSLDNDELVRDEIEVVLARLRGVDSPAPEADPQARAVIDRIPKV